MRLIFFLGLILQAFLVWGEDEIPLEKKPALRLGANVLSYRYVEGGLISHSGALVGIHGDYFWTSASESLKGVLSGEAVFGPLTYDGSLCDTTTNDCTPYRARTNDLIMRVTHRFVFQGTEDLNFFIGPGFRFLFDKGVGSGFYARTGSYLFLPLGGTYHWRAVDLILDFEYDHLLKGQMRSSLSDVNPSYGDITHQQSKGSGHRITLSRDYSTSYIAVYYEGWILEDSNIEPLMVNGVNSGTYFVEPENFTNSFGLKLGLLF